MSPHWCNYYAWINLKFGEEWDIYIVSNYLPTKYLLITKGKKYLTMENLGRHHLKWSKLMVLLIIKLEIVYHFVLISEKNTISFF